MNEKPWYMSKGIMGPIAALIAELIARFGHSVGFEIDQNQLIDSILQLTVIIGIAVGIWGRWYAQAPIKPVRSRRKVAPPQLP